MGTHQNGLRIWSCCLHLQIMMTNVCFVAWSTICQYLWNEISRVTYFSTSKVTKRARNVHITNTLRFGSSWNISHVGAKFTPMVWGEPGKITNKETRGRLHTPRMLMSYSAENPWSQALVPTAADEIGRREREHSRHNTHSCSVN